MQMEMKAERGTHNMGETNKQEEGQKAGAHARGHHRRTTRRRTALQLQLQVQVTQYKSRPWGSSPAVGPRKPLVRRCSSKTHEVVGGRGRYHGRHNVGRGVATHICGASSSILCICQVTSAPSTVRPWKSAFSSSIPAAADDVLWAEPRETHFIGTCSCSCRAVRRRVVRRW